MRADREDREAAQARLVLVPVEHRPRSDPDAEWFDDEPDRGEITIVVHNYSSAPVLLPWVVDVVHVGRIGLSWFPEPGQLVRDPAIPAQGERRFRGMLGSEDYEVRPVSESDSYRATVGFTDAAGLVWRRTDQELPVRHLAKPPRPPRAPGRLFRGR